MPAQVFHSIFANAKEIWGYIGPLVGLYAGSLLTKSAQRKQWLLDRRKEEYRELLSAMTHATIELQTFLASKGSGNEQPIALWLDAYKAAARIVADRIYIAEDLEKADIAIRYLNAAEKLRQSGDAEDGCDEVALVLDEVLKLARKG